MSVHHSMFIVCDLHKCVMCPWGIGNSNDLYVQVTCIPTHYNKIFLTLTFDYSVKHLFHGTDKVPLL